MPRLFDLVRVRDKRMGLAFYFALRDTVVAADLEQASRIAYGGDRRWARVVTLKVGTPAGMLRAKKVLCEPPACSHLAGSS